ALEEEEDEEVERELILALGRIGSPDAVQALIKFAQPAGRLFGRKPSSLRLAAVEALRLAATPAAIGTLQGLSDDGDKQVRGAALIALAQMKKNKEYVGGSRRKSEEDGGRPYSVLLRPTPTYSGMKPVFGVSFLANAASTRAVRSRSVSATI